MLGVDKSLEILGLPHNACYVDAKTAYRELANILHPDKHMHNERLRERATDKFKQLQSAWNELETYYKAGGIRNREQEQYERRAWERDARERERRETERREKEARERQVREREAALRAEALRQAIQREELEVLETERRYAREKIKAADDRKLFKVAFPIYLIVYAIILSCFNGWGVVLTFFTAPMAFLFLYLKCFGVSAD